MNKQDLTAAVASSTGLTLAKAGAALDAVTNAVTEALKKDDDVRLVGFGTFSISARAAREGRNPRTGKAIKIAASKAVKFSAGAALKGAVNS